MTTQHAQYYFQDNSDVFSMQKILRTRDKIVCFNICVSVDNHSGLFRKVISARLRWPSRHSLQCIGKFIDCHKLKIYVVSFQIMSRNKMNDIRGQYLCMTTNVVLCQIKHCTVIFPLSFTAVHQFVAFSYDVCNFGRQECNRFCFLTYIYAFLSF